MGNVMPNLNPEQAFADIKNAAAEAVKKLFPIVGAKHVLSVEEITVDDKAGHDDIDGQLSAKISGDTWAVPVKGKMVLTEKDSGKVLDRTVITLLRLPRLTNRYTYIVGGHERQVDGNFVLKPGVYHRVAANGDMEAQWNLQVGHGFSLSLSRNAKGIPICKFSIKTSNVPIYPVLSALGVSDAEMERAWSTPLFVENKRVGKWRELLKIPKAVARNEADRKALAAMDGPSPEPVFAWVRDFFGKTRTKRPNGDTHSSIGVDFDAVDGRALFASTTRLFDMAAGRAEQDDRQSLSAKDFVHIEDMIGEALQKQTYAIIRKVRNTLDIETKVSRIMSTGILSKPVHSIFTEGQIIEQHNPLAFVSGHVRTGLYVTGERTDLSQDQLINPTHIGFLDPIQTPEGETTGITLHLPLGVRKRGRDLITSVWSIREKKMVDITPGKLERSVVAYPDQVTWPGGRDAGPKPVADNVIVYDKDKSTSTRPWSEVDYVFPSPKAMYSFSANKVPFLSTVSGGRAMMAAKQQEQAVSLLHREPPLVQSNFSNGKTFDDALGIMSSHTSPVAGTVAKVGSTAIEVKDAAGKTSKIALYNHFPLNGGKAMMHSTPTVQVGDKVTQGQLVADTNFTKNGVFAAGTNVRVAYVPYNGLTFEDGIVISDSAAKKLTSNHVYAETAYLYDGFILDAKRWASSVLPEKKTPAIMAKLDEKGVVKVGERVMHGDVLVAVLSPSRPTLEEQEAGKIHKVLRMPYSDRYTLRWEHDAPGVVKRVSVLPSKVVVHVYVEEPMQVGDKLTGRFGNKGIISKILPDAEMPRDKKGQHMEVLLSPIGVTNRMNPGQLLETAASKIARKTGKTYVVDNFAPGVDYTQKVLDDLKKHGLSDTDVLYDGKSGAELGPVLTGEQHMLKLHHQVEKKITARSHGGSYSADGMPTSGSGIGGGGQKVDQLTMYALLAHGANANIREMQTWKSDKNQADVWTAIQRGEQPPNPKPTQTMARFQGLMRAMGISMEKKGDSYHLSPLTDEQTRKFSNGEIKFASRTLTAKGMRTLEDVGGLFDRKVVGGINGAMWSHMALETRLPNPVFEEQIQTLLDVKSTDYAKLVGGGSPGGFDSIIDGLGKINVDKELASLEKELPKLKGSNLNKAVRKIRYLKHLKEQGKTPLEAYSHTLVPVLPPTMRSVKIGIDGDQIFDDTNQLYKNIGIANEQLRAAKKDSAVPKSEIEKLRGNLYQNLTALRMTGMDSGTGGAKLHYSGIMQTMKGVPQPKDSLFHNGILGRRQDLSARSTIIPAPHLNLDEIEVPAPIAMEIFKPFVTRELSARLGYTPIEARMLIKQKAPVAMDALNRVVAERPVLSKRDPALHKHSLLAFRAKVSGGKAIGLHPLVCSGFNADFDGDQMPLYVPVSNEAIEEAKNMLPSKNLFSPTHYGVALSPAQDGIHGVYLATEWGKPTKEPFKDIADLVMKIKSKKIDVTDEIIIDGVHTTAGRAWIASAMPESPQRQRVLTDKTYRIDKKEVGVLLDWIGKKHTQLYVRFADTVKECGNTSAYTRAASFSLHDFHDGRALREKILAPFKAKYDRIISSTLSKEQKDAKVVELYTEAISEVKKTGEAHYKAEDNRVYEWSKSGGGKGWDQFVQLVIGPILVADAKGRPVPVPITKSWGEGLTFSQYWSAMHGARKGAIDRSNSTKDPGALTKDLINTVINHRIESEDCGTTDGEMHALDARDTLERFTSKPVTVNGHTWPAKTLLTSAIITEMRKEGLHQVEVRTPLHCHAGHGVCSVCFGNSENGRPHAVGTNIGVIAGQALGEPVTQLVMRTFHTGGAVAGAGAKKFETGAFKRADQLLKVPKTLRGSAILAEARGVVSAISPDKTLGGFQVHIGAKDYHIPADRGDVIVKVGQSVEPGTPLSEGPINPRELLEATDDIHKVRKYLTDELHSVYQLAAPIRRRNVETVVRAMTNVARVEDVPKDAPFMRGAYAPLSKLEAYNRAHPNNVVHYKIELKPITEVPLTIQEDWMARANYRELQSTFTEGAAQGWHSNIHESTIAGIAHGAEFGVKRVGAA